MPFVLVQKVLPIHNEAQFAPSGPIFQLPVPPNLAPLPGIGILSQEPWFLINGQPVLSTGDVVPCSTGTANIVGMSHWLVNGKPLATFGIATAPPLGINNLSSQLVPYFSA